ncbi:MAG: hypothetical protein F4Y31_00565 [Gammaproteobacteria bacterium]|nr:hypothetical protein [Chromatiales bacterium]MYA29712.1 hypothetical protein [Gammaproteobacteria bacterium]MYF67192.1 hypothetical protein [Gammaproteobacteria bacterium]MYK36625.1 hypothetical protein [Gammaproteobacteria bacterium]
MKNHRRILLSLAGALLVVQPALACHCLDDLLGHARQTIADDPSCSESSGIRHGDMQHGESPECADCGDYEPAPAISAAKAIANNHPPEFNPAPAIAGHPPVFVRPQTVRNIGPPRATPRAALTPVLLKQRLLT